MTNPPMLAAWNTRGFNSPDKALCWKNLVNTYNLDLIFILETRISIPNTNNNWFLSTHSIYPHEGSYDNFAFVNPDKIWVKWNSLNVSFKPVFTSSQLIHGQVFTGNAESYYVFVVYTSNSLVERQILWRDLSDIAAIIASTWIILVDFNCCRYTNEKAGGSLLTNSKVSDFNNLIFNIGAHELSYVGHFFTWFNQRTGNPIHIKLDRMLVNEVWLQTYPNSYYLVDDPQISDHSPIILHNALKIQQKHRFLFKNYWVSKPEFWDELISVFSQRFHSSPIHSFCHKLKTLMLNIKSKNWVSSNALQSEILELTSSQNSILRQIHDAPLELDLNLALKEINHKLLERNSNWSDWVIQRAKAKWLTCGEDDLRFLYSRINARHNTNLIKSITTSEGTFSNPTDLNNAIIRHFHKLFNTALSSQTAYGTALVHLMVPENLIPSTSSSCY
ncbi:uncharacterized protein LOC110115389 [Dendrobium catenatum]|uniref:uncharacterized protein LOC110115389 n=1 Tax=Dendrobium catenatum TaxID=906689 RepID=UPI0009F54ED4|nr:uncharacterized protein LOC110115389 [Dendrobium catenatum]